MIIAAIIFFYVLGFVVTAKAVHREWLREFGADKEFMDFFGGWFCAALAGLVWPIWGVALFGWAVHKRRLA